MLSIKNIKKVYKTGSLVQQALGGVSLSLRDNEFVAVLGQSGSGKTTLLNIIGGLDRYDEGDLIINGISTKKYTDRDWDSYRNHTVGFVFQSYNLIPHQTVLKNVELALTISGTSSRERTQKAKEALIKVGLEEHIHKKPSQLSGGQMQRVAIARALVNDPDILLADEPTGALDSDTSIQVMDLLKEVARDRLVVMVTHNPELAERYATRIVTLKDGMITSDSDPFEPEEGDSVHKNLGRASMSFFTALLLSFNNLWTKKARTILVSFAGSIGIIGIAMILSLSTGANDYIRKVEEESLQSYPLTITDTTFNLLSMYAGTAGAQAAATADEVITDAKNDVEEWRTITGLFSGSTPNDLKALKAYFESGDCDIYDYVQALEYDYNLVPHIYKDYGKGWRQINPEKSFSALGLSGSDVSMSGLLSSFSSTDSFFPLPADEDLLKSAYDIKSGRLPEKYNECVVVLSDSGKITDMTVYILGLKDFEKLDEMIQSFAQGESVDGDTSVGSYSYDDMIGAEFTLACAADYYTYDKEYKVWTDRSSDKKYMDKLLSGCEKIKVVGVVQPSENSNTSALDVGIGYPASLTGYMIEIAEKSKIVQAQINAPEINVFTGKPFGEEQGESELSLSSFFKVDEDAINKAFAFDPGSFDFSNIDTSSLDFSGIDLSSAFSADDFAGVMPALDDKALAEIFSSLNFNFTQDTVQTLFTDLLNDYSKQTADDPRARISELSSAFAQYMGSEEAREILAKDLRELLESKSAQLITADDLTPVIESLIAGYPEYLEELGVADDGSYAYLTQYLNSDKAQQIIGSASAALAQKLAKSLISAEDVTKITSDLAAGYESYAEKAELPSVSYLAESFAKYLGSDSAKAIIGKAVAESVDASGLEKAMEKYQDMLSQSMQAVMARMMTVISQQLSSAIGSSMNTLMTSLSENMMNVFDFDSADLSKMFKTSMSAEEMKDLIMSLISPQDTNYDTNLKKLGYADIDKPSTITIYPSDFDSKQHIKDLISAYNARMTARGEDDKVINYTDMVDALMGSVTIIINVISYVLIAFVAISLVVSSIMIGVITYISVLERKKEIGILRAIGASKRNISQVFNAETFIIGTLAGVIGIAITELLIIPANLLIHALSGVENINAVLPPLSAFILILLSIGLTLIGGLIPSRKASKSDPVAALRSE